MAERQAREQAAAQATAAAAPVSAPATTRPTATATPPRQPASTPPVSTAPATQVASAAPATSIAAATAPQNQDFKLVKRVNPTYPSQALRARTEGWVELSFTVGVDGSVDGVEVVNANPRRLFDREAMRALSQWKFTPRVENGKPVPAKARQRLEFTLN